MERSSSSIKEGEWVMAVIKRIASKKNSKLLNPRGKDRRKTYRGEGLRPR